MFGVILFFLILIFYGFVLSTDLFRKLFQEDKNASVKDFFDKWDGIFKSDSARVILAIIAVTVGLWNFFAPNFGGGGPTILGALIPSLIMILDSLVIFPGILGLFNIPQEQKDKVITFVDKYESVAGIITLISGILHLAFLQIGILF